MLERVPEHDCGPPGISFDLRQGRVADVWHANVSLEPQSPATAAPQGIQQGAVTRTHVDHRPRRGNLVHATRDQCTGPVEHFVPDQSKAAASPGPVPGPVGAVELISRRPRVGGRGAAGATTYPAQKSSCLITKIGTAPNAPRCPGCQLPNSTASRPPWNWRPSCGDRGAANGAEIEGRFKSV